MADKEGWISIWRQIQDHWLYKEKPYSRFHAFIDILLEANHTEQKFVIGSRVMICKRGESLKSLDTWAERWGWDKSKVRRFLVLLQNDSMIVIKNEQKTTRLTIVNYDTYQVPRNVNETRLKRKRNANETQVTPNNNVNNENNVNNDNNNTPLPPLPENLDTENFRATWQEWEQYRVERKKKLTPTTIAKQVKQLVNFTEPEAIAMLEQSMANGWIGIFELKGKQYERSTTIAGKSRSMQTGFGQQKPDRHTDFVFNDDDGTVEDLRGSRPA